MRTSERIAAAVAMLMTAPAFLAFPALGAWYVHGVWGGLDGVHRGLFLSSAAMLCWTVPHVFRGRFKLFFRGSTGEFSLMDETLILGPIAVGTWAVGRNWAGLVPVLMCIAFVLTVRFDDWIKGADGLNGGTTPSPLSDVVEARDGPSGRGWRPGRPKPDEGVACASRRRGRRLSKHGPR